MALDVSGALLEGIRISTGNNPFTFPPRSIVTDDLAFNSIGDRAEYVLIAASTDPSQKTADIADTTLRFRWTKNESVVLRFTYDHFSGRFMPAPGGPPDEAGLLENEPRLFIPVPDETVLDAPFDLYIGFPTRILTFTFSFVGAAVDFSPPGSIPSGTVELSREDGQLNFSQADVDSFGGATVLSQRQGFFDRVQTTGSIGELPGSSVTDYFMFLNPRPATGQTPRVRIGYRALLTAVEVPDEGSLGAPAVGTFRWALDTGRVRFATSDVGANPGIQAYYDGVTMGEVELERTALGFIGASHPAPAFSDPGLVGAEPTEILVFADLSGQTRQYFRVIIRDLASIILGRAPRQGTVYLEPLTGALYFSFIDLIVFAGWTISYLNTLGEVENGVSVQLFRSGVNQTGEPNVPDFSIIYSVEDQVVVDGMSQSPFVMLPTTPIVDGDLEFRIARGPSSSGTFTGPLVDGADPLLPGFGYLLDLDAHQLSFSNRKSVTKTLRAPTPSVKLDDAVISELGFEAEKNGSPVAPGLDFDFDPDTGLLEFLQPVGENSPGNVLGVAGLALDSAAGFYERTEPQVSADDAALADTSRFESEDAVFAAGDVGKYLFVPTGDNVGIRTITSFISGTTVRVYPPWVVDGSTVADLKETAEVIADRFWTKFLPPYKKFSLAKADSPSGSFVEVPNTEFDVFKSVGQVNLDTPTKPGEAFQITYVALESDDDGATSTPVNKVERALFKIRQELATPVGGTTGPVPPRDQKFGAIRTVGTSTFTFNPDGKTVNTARPIVVYVNGMLLEPEDFTFEAPGTVRTADKVGPDQIVVMDYWVEDSPGGNTSFTLIFPPIDLDTPEVVQGEQDATYNGDQTDVLAAGSAFFVDETEVIVVQSSSHDSSADVTNVTFESVPTVSSDGADLLVTAPIGGSFRITETSSVDVFTQGTREIFVTGNQTLSYVIGTVVTVDGEPYSILSSSYDAAANRTTVSTSAPSKRNYITPTITRTIRPILFPGGSFQTSTPANISQPFTLTRMGNEREVLESGIDYVMAEGGVITLNTEMAFGDELIITYVARDYQPRFTTFELNYAYAIAPNQTNGMAGQRLLATYNLYAPDTFFYRVETVQSFIPEVVSLLQSSASSGASGPNTGDASSQSNKDFGSPSLYFEEQHQENLDVTVARLLKLYNDLINIYEDILSDIDGRIVGGNQGRFRFDGNFDNPLRNSFGEITNDVDDTTKLYDLFVLTGFFTFEFVPIFGTMAVPNSLSRIFPTIIVKTGALTDETSFLDLGNTMGSLDQANIRSLFFLTSTKSNSFFDEVDGSGLVFTIPKNGDAETNLPRFEVDQDVDVYTLDGLVDVSAKVLSADTAEPATIILDTPATVTEGSLLRNVSDGSNDKNHIYMVGRDLIVDFDNGQIVNFTLPPPLDLLQRDGGVVGEELVDGFCIIGNTDIVPKRIPVLDGLELNDDGRAAAPRLKRTGEELLLAQEGDASGTLGFATVKPDKLTVEGSTITVAPGQEVTFINGPNTGSPRTVDIILTSTSFKVTVGFANIDATGSDFQITSSPRTVTDVLAALLGILDTNVEGPPADPSSGFGPVNSEILAMEAAIACWGTVIASGTGTTTSLVLTDGGADFTTAGANAQSLLFVPSGANRGLYKAASVTATTFMIDATAPYVAFPFAGSTPYQVIQPESFLSTDQFDFVAEFYRETLAFLASTEAYAADPTDAGKVARAAAVAARLVALSDFVVQLEGVLIDGGLYDTRYLWIDQRTNRKEGLKTKQTQAETQRAEDQVKLIADQQKLLIAQSL